MRDADDVIDVAEREFHQFVQVNAARVGEAEQRVVGVDGLAAHRARVQDALVRQRRRRLVPVHDLDALAQQDLAEQREEQEQIRQRRLVVDLHLRAVVHLSSKRAN